jgi:hypothetical protein
MNESNALFERTADMLEGAWKHGLKVGVQGCVGTETPLSYPLPPPPVCTVGTIAGCYQDTAARILPHTVTISSVHNDQEWCAGECQLAGYTYAGVEYGVACLCGNAPPAASAKVDDAKCSAIKCKANAQEDCGGSYLMVCIVIVLHMCTLC